jgi:hypothetical protein
LVRVIDIASGPPWLVQFPDRARLPVPQGIAQLGSATAFAPVSALEDPPEVDATPPATTMMTVMILDKGRHRQWLRQLARMR